MICLINPLLLGKPISKNTYLVTISGDYKFRYTTGTFVNNTASEQIRVMKQPWNELPTIGNYSYSWENSKNRQNHQVQGACLHVQWDGLIP